MLTQTFETRLGDFATRLQELYNLDYATKYPNLIPSRVSFKSGSKYVKIITTCINQNGSDGQRLVYCFVEKKTGNILKAAGWAAPAAGKRGNIWNEDCDVGPNKPANMHGSGLYR